MKHLALDLTQPASSARRIELVSASALVLSREGEVGWGFERTLADPEMLIFDPSPVNFRLKGERKWGGVKAPSLVELNGEYVDHGLVKPGDRLRWWDFELNVIELPPLGDSERAMVDASRSSDAALNVYADWLESNGKSQHAEWARLMLRGVPSGSELLQVGPSFRALVTRAPIERCMTSCGQRWESLELSADPFRRECAQCMRTVTWCEDVSAARGLRDLPVVIDLSAPRTPGDLLRSRYVIG